LRVIPGFAFHDTGFIEEAVYTIRRQRAYAKPMLDAVLEKGNRGL
jgi:hypothetical protein